MDSQEHIWLAAYYTFATTYSCRVPMSSANNALALPTPGPATVCLAMIRSGIELFGIDFVRNELFPIIRSADIRIRPPDKVAISPQVLQIYKVKAARSSANSQIKESLAYREMCQANGPMTVFIKIPAKFEDAIKKTLSAIGYWGQANSLTYCINITHETPIFGHTAIPIRLLQGSLMIKDFFTSISTELRDKEVEWEEVVPTFPNSNNKGGGIQLEIYIWPMVMCEQHSHGRLLEYCSLV